ncbi:MAG: Gmad2 immunoglobulin-like domain-containing protein, partial [Anaerolineales bacterium]|nr:Gmad2 immunoglobulin-like domain-containing protein [Anaerolineales bacterium]
LNGDGADDAAVILTVDPDGTGVFYHLFVVLSDGGAPAQAAEAFLGDRVALQSLTIESGEIIAQMNVAGPEDGACCPSQPSLRRYRLETDLSLSVTLAENGLQVTYPLDYGGDALGYAVAGQPATPWTPTGDDSPAEFGLHLPVFGQAVGVPNDTPFGARIRVYPVRSFAYYGYDEELALLQALLAEPNPDLSVYSAAPGADVSPRLPYLPTANASQVFRAQPALIGFGGERGGSEGGRGVRYLTHYAQGFVPLTRREVWYTFQGLTEDGSYYLSVTFPIRIEDLEETAPLTFDPPDFLAYLQERFQVVQNAGNIQPSLSLLDSIVNAIAITADPIPAQVITIDSPADGAQGVQSGAIIKGTASIWPFEATLVYEVHDGNGNLIGQGPINTVGDIPGPVTFEAPITFTPTEAGLGWIDVLDLSAKDGSVVGADRIEVQLVP